MHRLFELSTNIELTDTEVRTPPPLVEEMLDRLPTEIWNDPTKTFIDLVGGTGTFIVSIILRLNEGLRSVIPDAGARWHHIMTHQVHYNDINPLQVRRYRAALRKLGVEHLAQNVYNCNVLEQEFNMKFDVVVGNPPYQKGMHLKFLEKAYEICDHLIFVHPAEWLVQKRKIGKNSAKRIYYRDLKDKINDRCSKIIFIDSPWGKDVQLWVPLVITCISKGKTDGIEFINNEHNICSNHFYNEGFTEELKSIHDIHRFGKGYIANSIVEKVHSFSKKSNWLEHLEKRRGDFYISLPNFTGHAQKMDYQTVPNFLGKDRTMCATFSIVDNFNILNAPLRSKPQGPNKEGNIKPWLSFEKHEEAKNALDFLGRTKFIRAFLSIIKIDQNACNNLLSEIPWLDWNQQWTDEKINEMMGFNKEEIEWIEIAFNKISKH